MQYAKVAEYQLRGVVHFHALIRLDGPRTPDGFAPAPAGIDADHAGPARAGTPPAGAADRSPVSTATTRHAVLAFGRQLDARPVRTSRRTDDPDRALTPEQVAGYLAKYATKSADDTRTPHNPHRRRLRATVRDLADAPHASVQARRRVENPYELLGKWVHMLGFRGHFASKSRRYSVTLGAAAPSPAPSPAPSSPKHRDSGRPLDLAALEADLLADDDTETTLVIGHWNYVGSGWDTDGERPSPSPPPPAPASTPNSQPNRRTHTDWAIGRENGGIADRGPTLVGSGRVGIPRHTRADVVRVAECSDWTSWPPAESVNLFEAGSIGIY